MAINPISAGEYAVGAGIKRVTIAESSHHVAAEVGALLSAASRGIPLRTALHIKTDGMIDPH